MARWNLRVDSVEIGIDRVEIGIDMWPFRGSMRVADVGDGWIELR